jgi:glycogen operon protein
MTTLLLSQGVPMIAHGDEIGRSQDGNNNAYCQDNDLTWIDWELTERQADLLDFTRRVVQLRREQPVFRRRRFFAGSANHGGESDIHDISWFTPAGVEMSEGDWSNGYARSIMVFLNGQAIPEPDRRGQPIRGDNILLIFNGHYESAATSINKKIRRAGSTVRVEARSTLVLRGPADRGLIPPRGAAYAPLTRTMPS